LNILEYPKECNICYINDKSDTALQLACRNKLENVVMILKYFEKQIDLIENKNECLICCNDNDQNMRYNKCDHIISICNDCVDKLTSPYKCPICRENSPKIKKCYLVT
jgi:hypothetical protein